MAGVLDVREYPLFDEEGGQGLLAGVDEVSDSNVLNNMLFVGLWLCCWVAFCCGG
jgi:hypothetical protein